CRACSPATTRPINSRWSCSGRAAVRFGPAASSTTSAGPTAKCAAFISRCSTNAAFDWSGSATRTSVWRKSKTVMTSTLSKERLTGLYRQMLLIRRCEEQLARSHQRGLIHGACHTYVGQEAIAVGVCAHLRTEDTVFSTHRGHGHALAKGVPPEQLIAELYGRATGCSHGRGGSMHLFAPEVGMMGTSGIV